MRIIDESTVELLRQSCFDLLWSTTQTFWYGMSFRHMETLNFRLVKELWTNINIRMYCKVVFRLRDKRMVSQRWSYIYIWRCTLPLNKDNWHFFFFMSIWRFLTGRGTVQTYILLSVFGMMWRMVYRKLFVQQKLF